MIVFDGVSIDSVAPVMIEDIKVSPIRYNPVVRPRAIRFGSEFCAYGRRRTHGCCNVCHT
jgi:hypothetical protein